MEGIDQQVDEAWAAISSNQRQNIEVEAANDFYNVNKHALESVGIDAAILRDLMHTQTCAVPQILPHNKVNYSTEANGYKAYVAAQSIIHKIQEDVEQFNSEFVDMSN